MSKTAKMVLIGILVMSIGLPVTSAAASNNAERIDRIVKQIEKRYAGKGFTAKFFQESSLKAMQITDTADGQLAVKQPGKMRWEYTVPEVQTIISDGKTMWIYRPADNQVMVGKAPEYFGGGKGAGFLSDIGLIRKSFTIQWQQSENDSYDRLKLIPRKPNQELADIIISVNRQTYQIDQVVTHNAYGDETRIVLSDYQFNVNLEDAQFKFDIPKGTDVVQMDQF